MRTYKLNDKIKVKGYENIEFEIYQVNTKLYISKGIQKETIFYAASGRHGLVLQCIYPENIVDEQPPQTIDELLDTYNSFLKLEEIYQNGKYKKCANIVMEKIRELGSKGVV